MLENSPAGANGTLKTGDRILAVNDIDLTQASHDRAVEVIRNANTPVKFLIQSLLCANTLANNVTPLENATTNTPTTPTILPIAELSSNKDENLTTEADAAEAVEVAETEFDEENKYNYTMESIREKYNYLIELYSNEASSAVDSSSPSCGKQGCKLFIFKLKRSKPDESLGLSLSGNVNLNKTSVFVCGVYANSIAQRHGLIKAGDQILEINGHCLYGRAHSNVTPLIRNIKDLDV